MSKQNMRKLLAEGRLFSSAILNANEVVLQPCEPYRNVASYKSIYHALYDLYRINKDFQEKFKSPTRLMLQSPILQLKPNHNYGDSAAILADLQKFATRKRSGIKKSAAADRFLAGIVFDGNSLNFQLNAEYNNQRHYASINKTLYDLYKNESEFKKRFEQPGRGIHQPFLELKEDHGYKSQEEIKTAIKNFLVPRSAPPIRKLLREGRILEGVYFEGRQVKLTLQESYNDSYFFSVNNSLYNLYNERSELREIFHAPKKGSHAPILTLRDGHDIDGEALIELLQSIAKPEQPRYPIRQALNRSLGDDESASLRDGDDPAEVEPASLEDGNNNAGEGPSSTAFSVTPEFSSTADYDTETAAFEEEITFLGEAASLGDGNNDAGEDPSSPIFIPTPEFLSAADYDTEASAVRVETTVADTRPTFTPGYTKGKRTFLSKQPALFPEFYARIKMPRRS